jgi:hypothetical protein
MRAFPSSCGKSISDGWKSWCAPSRAAASIAGCLRGPTSSTPSPQGIAGGPTFDSAEAASQYLITEHSICTVPWDDAGRYLRFSVTYEGAEAAEDVLMAATEDRLKRIRPVF